MSLTAPIGLAVLAVTAVIAGITATPSADMPLRSMAPPVGRFNHAMCLDSRGARALLFGGRATARGVADDPALWSWSVDGWRTLATSGPAPRSSPVLACGSGGSAIVFGGYGRTEYHDTWEWVGDRWHQRDSVGGPPASHSAGAFDPVSGSLIVFGGFRGEGATAPTSETWEWNGERWRRLDVVGPPARYAHAMVGDPANRRIVLYGGNAGFGPRNRMLTDTWEWNGEGWRQIGSRGPEFFADRALASEPGTGALVLVGGRADVSRALQVWRWSGDAWTSVGLENAPVTRDGVAVAGAPDGNGLLVFGGLAAPGPGATDQLHRVTASGWLELPGGAP